VTEHAPPAALLAELGDAERLAFARVFATAPSTPQDLRAQLSAHGQEITAAAARNEFLDTRAASAIACRLSDLLDEWDALTSAHRAVLHAAVAYYVLREDAEDDLDSVLGFEDDVAVVNACLRFLGREPLTIETT
jgi:uncharacterized membrane protein YkvA (DUF1232 family)